MHTSTGLLWELEVENGNVLKLMREGWVQGPFRAALKMWRASRCDRYLPRRAHAPPTQQNLDPNNSLAVLEGG